MSQAWPAEQFEQLELKAQVDPGDRLSFTLFLALVVHLLLIFGLDFKLPEKSNSSQTIEITLANYKALQAPEHADFVAQHNQEASGTIDEARQLTAERQAEFAATQVREVNPVPQQRAATKQQPTDQQLLTTRGQASRTALVKLDPERIAEQRDNQGLSEDQLTYTQEIASLKAKIDRQRQEYARRPRIRTLTSVSTAASFDAKYLNDWAARIEQLGTRNYPREALSRRITGNLRMSVVLNPDGTIYEMTILQSSGQRILDDAARQIVRMASPFAAFPPEMRKQADRLQIIRTWYFQINGKSSSIRTSAK